MLFAARRELRRWEVSAEDEEEEEDEVLAPLIWRRESVVAQSSRGAALTVVGVAGAVRLGGELAAFTVWWRMPLANAGAPGPRLSLVLAGVYSSVQLGKKWNSDTL